MEIDMRFLIAAGAAIIASYFFLARAILKRERAMARLKSDSRQTDGELLRARGEHAKELAELKADHAKAITALQGNVNDLSALLKEQNKSGGQDWLQKQRTRFGAAPPRR